MFLLKILLDPRDVFLGKLAPRPPIPLEIGCLAEATQAGD